MQLLLQRCPLSPALEVGQEMAQEVPPYFWPTGKVLEKQFAEFVLSKDSSHKVAAETFEVWRFVNTGVSVLTWYSQGIARGGAWNEWQIQYVTCVSHSRGSGRALLPPKRNQWSLQFSALCASLESQTICYDTYSSPCRMAKQLFLILARWTGPVHGRQAVWIFGGPSQWVFRA